MKKSTCLITIFIAIAFALGSAGPALALADNPVSMNARMMGWQEEAAVIHILAWSDPGRVGPAYVDVGQPLLFGFEWGYGTIEDLQATYIDNPDHTFTVSVDGGTPISIKSYYQPPLYAATEVGPAWTWDHDGDGPYDGDGDGVEDWSGGILFFRYPHKGMAAGEHTFVFSLTNPDTVETITVIAGP
jgi:hypothetical protein